MNYKKNILPPIAAVMRVFLFNVIHMIYNYKNILAPPAAIYEWKVKSYLNP